MTMWKQQDDLRAGGATASQERRCGAAGLAATTCWALLALAWVTVSAPAFAELVPQSFGGDSRIREVLYDPDQVLRLEGVVGYHLHLELEEGETFVNLGAGDTAAVEIGAEGRHLMLKPKQETVATNLTILTNKRVYTIEYTARRGRDLRPAVYLVRFRYPVVAIQEAPNPEPPATPRNLDYWACGAAELRPEEAFDDGVQTHLRFPARAEQLGFWGVKVSRDVHHDLIRYRWDDGAQAQTQLVARIAFKFGVGL